MNENGDKQADALQQSLLSERDRLQPEINLLRQQLDSKEQRLRHVLDLLSDGTVANEPPPRRARSDGGSTPTSQLLDMAEAILRERNAEPMHYRDLSDELMRRGAVIKGKDPAGGLVSRMTQDDKGRADADKRFIRPTSKGFYALREDYPNARNVGAKRRRRRNTNEPDNDELN